MKTRKKLIINISIALLVASACIHLSGTAFFWNLEFLSLDTLFHLRGRTEQVSQSSNIVVVEITDDTLLEFGRWPWPRARIAEMCSILKDLGPKQIFFDFFFTLPSATPEDDQLALAIKSAGNIYLPFTIKRPHLEINQALFPIPKFRDVAKGLGAATLFPDKDGKVRRIPLFFNSSGNIYKHIVLQMALDGLGMKIKKLTPLELVLANEKQELSIPLVEGNKMLLNWQGKWDETFKRYSFGDIYHAYHNSGGEKLSRADLSSFKNSTCLVAVTATGLFDMTLNPFEARYPGIGVIATALSNIYSKKFLRVLPTWVNLFVVYLLALIPPFYLSGERKNRGFLSVVLLLGTSFVTYFLFLHGLIMNSALPFIALLGSYIGVSLYNSACAVIEKKLLLALATTDGPTGLYNIRYFKEILEEECSATRKDSHRQFCILLCDIDHFKEFNDRYGHQVGDFVIENIARILKNSVRAMDLVARYGGDEMVVLLRQVSIKNACQVAEKIKLNIENSELGKSGQLHKVTVSIGVAPFHAQKDTATTVFKKADDALYAAKQKGKNQVCFTEE